LPLLLFWIYGEICHWGDKYRVFTEARKKADELGFPLVNYGCGFLFRHAIERSDYNLDVVERAVPNFVLVDPNSGHLPFEDKSVVVYCSHVLEHTEDPDRLLREFERVSDYVYIVTPCPLFLQSWFPYHKWVFIGGRRVRNPLWIRPRRGFITEL